MRPSHRRFRSPILHQYGFPKPLFREVSRGNPCTFVCDDYIGNTFVQLVRRFEEQQFLRLAMTGNIPVGRNRRTGPSSLRTPSFLGRVLGEHLDGSAEGEERITRNVALSHGVHARGHGTEDLVLCSPKGHL